MVNLLQHNPYEEASIPDGIDDNHIIAKLLSSGKFVHTDDNIVAFEELVPGAQMTINKQTVLPCSFRIGH
ncbi:hypothetical protein C0989_006176 [Termitomyces sp. Mn162]|nr:hypothetical protein C0989_006176 [Termitomyces sp. Mn162]